MSMCKVGIPARHVLCFMFVAGFIFTTNIRITLNLTIVAMVKAKNAVALNDTEELGRNENGSMAFSDVVNTQGEFEWSEFQQGLILSSFFYGYLASQIPGGRISEIYGIKPVFGFAVFINGVLALGTPFMARMHWILLLLIRIIEGLAQGVMYPALSSSIANWVPISERARFLALTSQGCSISPVIAFPLCGWIITTWGWPAVFYVTGAMAVIFCVFWYFTVYNTPEEHPKISPEEKKFLEDNLQDKNSSEVGPMPWKEALTSFQFWLGAAAHTGSDWGFHTFYTYGPKYIIDALKFDLSQSSLLSSLPFLSQYLAATLIGIVADKLIADYKVPIRRVRKISVFISHCAPGMLIILLTFIGQYVYLSMAVFTLAVAMLGALSTGYYQNPFDIAPNYAGSLTGIGNTLGSLGGVLCTTIAGASLEAYGSPKGWHVTFYVAAGVYAITSIPFIIWIKSQELPWNKPKSKNLVELNAVTNDDDDDDDESHVASKLLSQGNKTEGYIE